MTLLVGVEGGIVGEMGLQDLEQWRLETLISCLPSFGGEFSLRGSVVGCCEQEGMAWWHSWCPGTAGKAAWGQLWTEVLKGVR